MKHSDGAAQQSAKRTRPLVWVKQIVLYESIDPVSEIRRMNFTRGVNIIQGEASETDGEFESGHGIGKTTVCRLIRYCLGEKTFGQKHLMEEVKHCFPHAHVGAIIEVDGTDWAVLRPLGQRKKDCALERETLDTLIRSENPQPFQAFVDKLTAAVLSEFPVGEVLTSGQTLLWLHVLGMCSRDQESRYDRFWNWRHTRSESGTPKLGKPKTDAGLCLRALIGLLDPAEPRSRARLEQLDASLEQTRATLKEKRAEPAFHITGLRKSLATDYGVPDATDAPLDRQPLFGLSEAVRTRLEALRHEVAQIDEQLVPLDRQIALAAASLLEPAELKDQLTTASEVTGEGTDVLLAEIAQLRSVRQLIKDAEAALCRYGNVLIGQCNVVQARLEQVDQQLRERQRTTLPTVSEREQVAARLAGQAERQQSLIKQIQQRLDGLNRQKDDLVERRRSLNEQIRRIPLMLAEIQDWSAILDGTKPNTEVQALENDLATAESEREVTKAALAQLIAAQAERVKLFESRFDVVVKHTLTDDFKGVVEIEEEGIEFRIMRRESLSGEAYETLAVLLADLALLFESNAAHVHHPGILLHDSPREADLNLRIYQRMLDMADAHSQEASQNGGVPFQYIVTTTTSPSRHLQRKSITTHTLSGGTGSLFKRQLEAAKPQTAQPTLFDGEKDA